MTGRFDKYLLSQLLMLFGFFSLVLVLVYWVNRAVVLFDQLIANGQSAVVFLEFTALSLPNVIKNVLPIASFASAVYVTNRLTSESELVVVQATGFSPWRLVRPYLVFGLLVALFTSVLAHILVPMSLSRLAVRTTEVSENMTARLLSEGQFLHPADGVTFYIRQISPLGELQDIFLSDMRNPTQQVTYTARQALLIRGETAPKLIMLEGMAQVYRTDTKRLSVTRFSDFAFDLEGLVDSLAPARSRPETLDTATLLAATPVTQTLTHTTRADLIGEAHGRISTALNGLITPLIGFAALMIGGFTRFGLWRQMIGAVAALIGMQVLSRMGQDMVQSNADLWPLAYIGPAIGLVLGFGLLWLAAHPATLSLRRLSRAERPA